MCNLVTLRNNKLQSLILYSILSVKLDGARDELVCEMRAKQIDLSIIEENSCLRKITSNCFAVRIFLMIFEI